MTHGHSADSVTRLFRRIITLLLLLLLLGGCSGLEPALEESERRAVWRERQDQLSALDHWTLQGRVSLRRGDDAFSGGLIWEQRGSSYSLRLIPSLGYGQVTLEAQPSHVTLRLPDGRELVARDAERLLARELQWPVPIAGLRYWVIGALPPNPPPGTLAMHGVTAIEPPPTPAASTPVLQLDDHGRPATLLAEGWEVIYRDYLHEQGIALPRKLTLRRADLEMRLIVDEWALQRAVLTTS